MTKKKSTKKARPEGPSVSNLSKEEKLELLTLLEEKERKAKARRAVYKPNSGQLPIHQSNALIRIVASGNGAGKTTAAIQEALWRCEGYHPIKKKYTKSPTEVIVLLDQASKSDRIWVKQMRKWTTLRQDQLKKNGTPYTAEIFFDNGSRILFFSQAADEMVFEGISDYSMVIADEPCREKQFTALFRGARDVDSNPEFLVIGTPLGPNAAWIRQLWDRWSRGEEPDVECFRTDSEVNRANLSEGFLEQFSRLLSEKERQVRLHGMFSDIDGLALSHLFNRETHVIPRTEWKWDPALPCVIAIDPHPSKSTVAVLMGVDRDNFIYVIDELSEKALPRQLAPRFKQWIEKYNVRNVICDSLGSQDGTGGEGFNSFIQVLNDCGIPARSTTFEEKSDEDFIDRISGGLLVPDKPNWFGKCVPKIRFLEGVHGSINDVEQVCWMRDKTNDTNKPKLDIRNRDFLAAIKYGLSVNLNYKASRAKAFYRKKMPYGYKRKFERGY